MFQHEVVIKVMEEHGGYATLGYLYENVLKNKELESKSKTPYESIRRIVQDKRYFFKIKPGLWALNTFKNELPDNILLKEETSKHTYYQGLLIELGNVCKFQTFVPNQDKNKLFLDKKLSEIATLDSIYNFCYGNLLNQAKYIDVIWFNERKMPERFYEIETTGRFERSLIKYNELQDFFGKFFIVADSSSEKLFKVKIDQNIFRNIRERVKFLDFDKLSDIYNYEYIKYLIMRE